ncbi:asparagine synthase C-terminal domain-containing protein [Sphingomonas sp. QA11]|uniref:asparagine synthase-related protein n=1 Tax=Sphingomonas sp. QA11 TaxID=2950605 RepID=UPI00234B7553|nr:asparagine synthase C-terminal domain-containing protein [Sphingomonas sp. QA11]WCM29578.1 asparagine synthase C-terminal domain-containing protein [Sphingomonas sp. QA11]
MLSLHLLAGDAGLDWHRTATGIARGSSQVDPYRHDALEEVIAVNGERLLVCVRERCAGLIGPEIDILAGSASPAPIDAERFDRLVGSLRAWPLQWHLLIVDRDTARLEAGHWGTAPVFLVARPGGELRGHWDADRLLPGLERTSLDPARAARWIAEYDAPYARRTLFRDLMLLTERAVATWRRAPGGDHGLDIAYPAPWPRPVPGTLRPEADPLDAFEDILRSSMRRWTRLARETLGAELSGGLDSGLVAAIASRESASPLASYGLAIPGMADAVADQPARRADLIAAFGLRDTEIPMEDFLPLAPGSCRLDGNAPVLPWEEGYYEAMDHLLERAYAAGTRVMLTGFGGDELCGLRPSEQRALGLAPEPAWSLSPPEGPAFLTPVASATLATSPDQPPRAASCDSSVEVAAFSAARYLRHGIWPVHPLCTPELVHFCARLPAAWRADRTIERALLARLGATRRVTHPAFRDDLSPALVRGMRFSARPLLDRLFAQSNLAGQGIVDGARLRRDYAEWCERDDTDGAERYYAVAILELCLARMR